MDSGLKVVSYTFATMAGICLFSGLAIISDKGVKQDGKARDNHANARRGIRN